MFLTLAVVLTLIALAYTLLVRSRSLPQTPPDPPHKHLEGRKDAIYENLRDLQFEYRVGKLSDQDYQRTKTELQAELAAVLAEIDRLKAGAIPTAKPAAKSNGARPPAPVPAAVCPHCNAKFDKPMRFCGECGKPMEVTV
jgi:hypothetical protein